MPVEASPMRFHRFVGSDNLTVRRHVDHESVAMSL
jgi:hypothetical protein